MAELPCGFLAVPSASDRTMLSLRRKLRLLTLQTLLTAPRIASACDRLNAALMPLAKSNSAGVLEAVGSVDVMVPLLAMRSGMLSPDEALGRAVPTLLASLDWPEAVLWDVPVSALIADRRAHTFDPAAQGLVVNPSGLEVRLHDGALAVPKTNAPSPFFAILAGGVAGGPQLSSIDTNPLAHVEDHPDKEGNAVDLAGRDPELWCDRLRGALDVVADALPTLHAELVATLQRVIPVGYHDDIHLSASYREAPGLIYLTLHPSALTLAEAIIHETQHGKLNTVSWFDAILFNGHEEWTKSAVRPDMRPLMGVLLAVHAFVPVAALHMRLKELDHPLSRQDGFERRRAEVLASNKQGLETLDRLAKPSELGSRVLDALRNLDAATSV